MCMMFIPPIRSVRHIHLPLGATAPTVNLTSMKKSRVGALPCRLQTKLGNRKMGILVGPEMSGRISEAG